MDPAGATYAMNAKMGAVLWSFESGGTVYSGPAMSGDVV
jgi:hypothetical protein